MTTPRKLTLFTSAAVGVAGLGSLRRSRKKRLGEAAQGIADTILPSGTGATAPPRAVADEAHAPGHRHLAPPPPAGTAVTPRVWPWSTAGARRDRRGTGRWRS